MAHKQSHEKGETDSEVEVARKYVGVIQFLDGGLQKKDGSTRSGVKTRCYFFASVLVRTDTMDLDLDFVFWANCWLHNPSKPCHLLSKVVLENQPDLEPANLGEQQKSQIKS